VITHLRPKSIAKVPMRVKLGLVQMRMSKDEGANLDKAVGMVRECAQQGANVVCLPELFGSLYFPQVEGADVTAEAVPNHVTDALSRSAKENGVVLVGGSVYEKSGGKSYNTTLVFDEHGRELGRYRKVHIPQDPSFYEQDYFSSGSEYKVFETSYGRVAVLICFDQWYPEQARICKLLGAQILFYPTAIGTVRGIKQAEGNWQEAWEAVQRGHAVANSMVVAAVNRVGTEGEMRFWGGSFVYDQFGKRLARGDARERTLVTACDLQLGEEVEKGWGFIRNRKPGTYARITKP
jgi:predicted amidohydrolase